MNMKKILAVLFALIYLSVSYAQQVPVPAMPDPRDTKPTKNQWGIIASCTAWYMKIRTCVRYTYDEIKYWEGTSQSYKQINKWFKSNRKFIKTLSDSTAKIFTNPKDVFVTLQRLENTFNGIDHLTLDETREFDAIMYSMESNWDKFASDTFVYTIGLAKSASCTLSHTPGILIPNTAQILGYVDKKMFGDSSGIIIDSSANSNSDNPSDISQYKTIGNTHDWPESRLKTANELIAAHALAYSSQYRLWSHRAMSRMAQTDSMLSLVSQGANGKEMAATWYALENVNSNSKRLRHSIEEAKLLEATLGTELYYKTLHRSQAMKQSLWAGEVSVALNGR